MITRPKQNHLFGQYGVIRSFDVARNTKEQELKICEKNKHEQSGTSAIRQLFASRWLYLPIKMRKLNLTLNRFGFLEMPTT